MKTRKVLINEKEENMRLDIAVSLLDNNISRTYAQELIKQEKILVNGKSEKASYKVKKNQEITLPVELEKSVDEKIVAEDIPVEVIYEDNDIIVVNKPKNMVVHPAIGNFHGTLVNAMLGKTNLSDTNGEYRPGIVHRLDKNTTGVMVIAKNNNAHAKISKQIGERKIKKIYVAIVKGIVKENEAIIELPIGRHPTNRKKMAVIKDGRPSYTKVKVLERFDGYTYVEVELKTRKNTSNKSTHVRHRISYSWR